MNRSEAATRPPEPPAGAAVPAGAVLVHGVATDQRSWAGVISQLGTIDVVAVRRPVAGGMDSQVAALADLAGGRVVAGASGGATVGLALAGAGGAWKAMLLHEPAVGSLLPGLLAGPVGALAAGGVDAFGSELYGHAWRQLDAGMGEEQVRREVEMFSLFEPPPRLDRADLVTVTVGQYSPPARHRAAQLLSETLGVRIVVVPRCGHSVQVDNPSYFSGLIRDAVASH